MCEFPVVYHMKVLRARKEHRCCECGGKILSGESYNYHSGVWDGQGMSFKVCPECDLLRKDLTIILAGLPLEETLIPFEGLLSAVNELKTAPTLAYLLTNMRKREAPIPKWLSDAMDFHK